LIRAIEAVAQESGEQVFEHITAPLLGDTVFLAV
jgi:hypothetical protein